MIRRYLFVGHLGLTLGVLGLVALALFLGQLADSARFLGLGGPATAALLLERAALRTPTLLQYVLPHVVVVSTALALQRLGARNELAVMAANGLSAARLLTALAASGAAVGLGYTLVANPLAAAGLERAERIDRAELGLRSEARARQAAVRAGEGTLYVFAGWVSAEGDAMRDVTVLEFDGRHQLARRVEIAEAAREGAEWRLEGVAQAFGPGPGAARRIEPPGALPFDPAILTRRLPPRHAVPVHRLPEAVAFAEATAAEPLRYAFQFHWLIALPALLGAVAFATGAVAFSPLIRRGWGRRALEVLAVAFPIYAAATVLEAVAIRGLAPVAAAAWAPPAALLVLGLVVLRLRRV